MNARDDDELEEALGDLIAITIEKSGGLDIDRLAERILASGWRPPARIIETAEELDALPNEAVIRDANGEMSMHINVPNKFNPAGRRIKWWGDCQGYGWNIPVLPATVVYTPEES